jgi:hypothetical protein
MNTG